MIDEFTLLECSRDRNVLLLKIENTKHAIEEAEKIISESQHSPEALKFLRRKIADSLQDLETLHLIDEKNI